MSLEDGRTGTATRQGSSARRRRPRRSDAETGRLMLDAALELLAEDGVSVALDGLQLEDVIRRADVSRTSAYRRWPTREAFLEDVLVELAQGAELTEVGPRVGAEGAALLAAHRDALTTEEGRREVFVELLRLSLQTDLEATLASPAFRTYLALRAAFVGVPSEDLRTRLAAALALSERRAVAQLGEDPAARRQALQGLAARLALIEV